MKIDFTNEMINMEPGPNLYFMGNTADFVLLHNIFIRMSKNVTAEVSLDNEIENVEMIGSKKRIILKSSDGGNILSKVEEENIIIDLDPRLWRKASLIVDSITKEPSHNYIEFDDIDLLEECNLIISSEW